MITDNETILAEFERLKAAALADMDKKQQQADDEADRLKALDKQTHDRLIAMEHANQTAALDRLIEIEYAKRDAAFAAIARYIPAGAIVSLDEYGDARLSFPPRPWRQRLMAWARGRFK